MRRAAEAVRRAAWAEWAERHGDWRRDAALYVAVRYGGCALAENVEDSPSVGWLLGGSPADPLQPGWGGQFVRAWPRPYVRFDL